jgi:hypothetical protein
MKIEISVDESFFVQILLARGVPVERWQEIIDRAKKVLPDMLAEHVEDEVERLVEEALEVA